MPPTQTTLRLAFAAPLDWTWLLTFLRGRAIPGVEVVDDTSYRRTVAIGDVAGWLTVTRARRSDRRGGALDDALDVALSSSLVAHAAQITTSLRRLFDLDAAPDEIDPHLARDPVLAPSVAARPGLRVPGAFDPFELAVRAILGQQVTVRAATTLSG
ncbi:adenosine deaminase, partial [Myxococcota bacterium]|nr:adenosine deaminase [Myxococcota bacterium]